MLISKSRYVTGLQCHKLLWLHVHERDAPELRVSPEVQARFDVGHRVGERARAFFPEGVCIDLDPCDRAPALAATRAALETDARVIFEAAFESDGAFAAVDVLERIGRGWALLEVKATLDAKTKHHADLAIQVYLARAAGLRIDRIEVMHLNRAHRHPDKGPLFLRTDVTEAVDALVPHVAAEVARQHAMLRGPIPDIAIGAHCKLPYPCPFHARCHPERPAHDISELYAIGRRAERLRARGYARIADLPDDEPLSPVGARQRRAVLRNAVVVEPELHDALAKLAPPYAFLDFESINPALPVWPDTAPYQAIPVQHSVHRLGEDGALEHHAFLAEPGADPRAAVARHLLDATAGASTVFAWSAAFERQRIEELALHLPALAGELRALNARIVDLLVVVRAHYYHPEFHGSFSLKTVGPVLAPELAYDDLSVANGSSASLELERYLFTADSLPHAERDALRHALVEYCKRDTELLVRVLEVLQRQVRSDLSRPV